MKLNFGPPEHGWMQVQFNEHELDVSDVPCDSLSLLMTALTHLVNGSQSESVEWSLEPEYATWTLERDAGNLVVSSRVGSQPSTIVGRCSLEVGLSNMIGALDLLAKAPCWKDDEEDLRIWSWPFPFIELKRLQKRWAEQVSAGNPLPAE